MLYPAVLINQNDKSQMNVHMLWEKSNNKLKTSAEKISDVCSRDVQSVTISNKEQFKDGCSKEQQSNKGDKNCQAEKRDMQPKEPNRICSQMHQQC